MFKRAFLTFALASASIAMVCAQGIIEVEEDDIDVVLSNPYNQVLKPYVLSIGPKLGVDFALAGNPDGMEIDMKGSAGFFGGIAGNVRFGRPAGKPYGTERFGVQLELLYSMRNLHNDVDNITMNNFEIPVLFQWYFLPNFAVELGPSFTGAFSTSPKEFIYNNTTYETGKIKGYDVMFSIGLNCKLRNGFTADVRYNLGNSDLAKNFQTKVSTISIGIGWLFNVIK